MILIIIIYPIILYNIFFLNIHKFNILIYIYIFFLWSVFFACCSTVFFYGQSGERSPALGSGSKQQDLNEQVPWRIQVKRYWFRSGDAIENPCCRNRVGPISISKHKVRRTSLKKQPLVQDPGSMVDGQNLANPLVFYISTYIFTYFYTQEQTSIL